MNINELDLKGLLESIKKEKQIQYNEESIEKFKQKEPEETKKVADKSGDRTIDPEDEKFKEKEPEETKKVADKSGDRTIDPEDEKFKEKEPEETKKVADKSGDRTIDPEDEKFKEKEPEETKKVADKSGDRTIDPEDEKFKEKEPEETKKVADKSGDRTIDPEDEKFKEKETTSLKKGKDNFTSSDTELTEKSAVVTKVGTKAYDPYDDLTRQSRVEETNTQLWENKSGRGAVSIKTGTLGNFSFFSWKDIEHGASWLLNKVGKNGYHPVGSVRQLLSNSVEGLLMIKSGNTDPFKIAGLAINSVGLFFQTSNINRGRYDLTPRDDFQGLSEEKQREKKTQNLKPLKVKVKTADGSYEEKDPEPKTPKSKLTDKQVSLKKGEEAFDENTSFEAKQPIDTKKVNDGLGNRSIDPEDEKFEEKQPIDTKKVNDGLGNRSIDPEDAPFEAKQPIDTKKVNDGLGNRSIDPEDEKFEEKQPIDTKKVNDGLGNRSIDPEDAPFEAKQPIDTKKVNDGLGNRSIDPEDEKFEEKQPIDTKKVNDGLGNRSIDPEDAPFETKQQKDIDFKLSGEIGLSDKRLAEKRLTENMSSIGYIYVSPVNIDHLKGVNFIKIPLQSNLVSNSDTRRATYISTDFISRVGSVKQYVSTESVSYSLETKYFVSSNISDTNGFTMEDLQKIESMYKSLVYPRYINQTSTESGMNESFYTRPPIINIVIGEHDNETCPKGIEDAPSASSNDSAGVINNFFTNVHSTNFNKKKVTYKYFIVTEVSIEKDYEKTPFYLESKKSESGEITVLSPKDLMGFDVKLTITEIDPNYFGVLPSFNDYASFGTLGQGSAGQTGGAGEVFGEVTINNRTYRDNTPV